LIPELLPAVTLPPSGLNAGFRRASASAEVSARGVFVATDHGRVALAAGDRHGDDLLVEPAGLDGRDRTLLAFEREGILPLA
jgi:CMP-2-keto-3-deoxyoctulosonic acid synthetase